MKIELFGANAVIKTMRLGIVLIWMLAGLLTADARASGNARRVLVVVWDGMRPDFVTEETTPTLWQLAQKGVWFENHHAVYLSATEVNGTAIATGAYPEHDGIIGNREYRPELDSLKPVHTESLEAVRDGDRLSGGHYLRAATVAELLQARGMKTLIAG